MFDKVFVTVGTTSFHKLIQLVLSDKAVEQFSKWGVKEVRIQGGRRDDSDTEKSKEWKEQGIKFQLYEYKPAIIDDMRWADLIICHAGAGTTIEGLDLRKILIVVPNETLMDNHQLELADKLGEENYAFKATIDTFFENIADVDVKKIRPFPPARPELLNEYLINTNSTNVSSKKK